MKNRLYLLLLISFSSLLSACSSVSSDAQKAAELKKESIEYTRKHQLDKAEKAYNRSQKIIDKYKNTEKAKTFSQEYSKAMKG